MAEHGRTGTNQEAVRRHNLGTVLRHVDQAGQISRAELTRLTGLNRSTIAGLVGELEALGVASQAGSSTAPPRAGRPSAQVALAERGPFVIAVDLGVDRAVVARVGLGGRIACRAATALDGHTEAWQVGATVASLVRQVVADAPADAALIGMGIGIPGLVRRSDGLVRLAPNLEWRDVSFGSIVLAALGVDVPVAVANDADLGALAEHQRGAGMGVDDLVYVSGNVGVGAGVVSGGRRIEGVGGYAGEVGHLRFDAQGPPCHCGNRGCWETRVGGHAIAAAIACPPDRVAQLGEVLGSYPHATPELRTIGTHVGTGLADIVNVFNPRMVVLGGYFAPLFGLVEAEVRAGLADHALSGPLEAVVLTTPGLGTDAVLVGAAEMAFQPLFHDPVASLGSALVDLGARLAG